MTAEAGVMSVLEQVRVRDANELASASPHRQVRALAWLMDPEVATLHRLGPAELSKRLAAVAPLNPAAGTRSLLRWLPPQPASVVAELLWGGGAR